VGGPRPRGGPAAPPPPLRPGAGEAGAGVGGGLGFPLLPRPSPPKRGRGEKETPLLRGEKSRRPDERNQHGDRQLPVRALSAGPGGQQGTPRPAGPLPALSTGGGGSAPLAAARATARARAPFPRTAREAVPLPPRGVREYLLRADRIRSPVRRPSLGARRDAPGSGDPASRSSGRADRGAADGGPQPGAAGRTARHARFAPRGCSPEFHSGRQHHARLDRRGAPHPRDHRPPSPGPGAPPPAR